MNLFEFSHEQILSYVIVLIRVSSMMVWFPMFGDNNTPTMVKILFSALISLIIFPIIQTHVANSVPVEVIPLIILVLQEITIGLLIGLVSKMVFYAISVAAQIISFQMGFGMVSIMDPNTQSRVSIIDQFQLVLATLLFFVMNIHYIFFEALIMSYQQVNPGLMSIEHGFLAEMLRISSMIFIVGFKIAAPVAVVLLITNAGFGILSRAVPQMNVFMISFPLTITIGFIMIGLSIPLFIHIIGNEYEQIGDNIFKILKTI